jgi:ribose transport system substrate-binding protein
VKRPSLIPMLMLSLVAALLVAACGSSSTSHSSSQSGTASSTNYGPPIGAAGSGPVTKTVGPNGEPASSANSVVLTPAEVAAIKAKHFTAAMAWHESGTFVSAVTAGADAEFKTLGIKVIATTQANFDAATQVNQLQTLQAEKPSVVLSLPVNPGTESSAYSSLSKTGSKLILLSNLPTGLKYPTQYQGLVTDDLSAMGKQAAELMGTALHGKGKVGFIYYDANYYVTNERDAAFRTWLKRLYPNIQIVTQQGMADPTKADSIATAMVQSNPDLNGIYVPFSQPPAEGVISGLRGLGASPRIKVVTMDLDPSIDANLCKGQYLAGIVADQPYLLGQTLAKEAGLALLGKKAPQFSVVKALAVTKSNIISAWQQTLDQSAPSNVRSACRS